MTWTMDSGYFMMFLCLYITMDDPVCGSVTDPRYIGCYQIFDNMQFQQGASPDECINRCMGLNKYYAYTFTKFNDDHTQCSCASAFPDSYTFRHKGVNESKCLLWQNSGNSHVFSAYKSECPAGYWGQKPPCSRPCGRCADGKPCNLYGYCPTPHDCQVGWMGGKCNMICHHGHFGKSCESSCHCYDNQPCDPVTGGCVNKKCAPGWIGDTCSQSCSKGTYGLNCSFKCPECLRHRCDPASGNCLVGCTNGWQGSTCTQKYSRKYVQQMVILILAASMGVCAFIAVLVSIACNWTQVCKPRKVEEHVRMTVDDSGCGTGVPRMQELSHQYIEIPHQTQNEDGYLIPECHSSHSGYLDILCDPVSSSSGLQDPAPVFPADVLPGQHHSGGISKSLTDLTPLRKFCAFKHDLMDNLKIDGKFIAYLVEDKLINEKQKINLFTKLSHHKRVEYLLKHLEQKIKEEEATPEKKSETYRKFSKILSRTNQGHLLA